VVTANEAAVKVQNAMREERGMTARSWGHYNFWLLYGYLQQGRFEKALELLQAAYADLQADGKAPSDRMILDPDRSLTGSVVQMWARYIIETRAWDGEAANWSFNAGNAFDPNLNISFVRALQAAHAGLAAKAGQYLGQFRKLRIELEQLITQQQEKAPTDLLYLRRLEVMEQELLAGVELARGDLARAVQFAQEASRMEGEMPFSFGPPFVDLPAAEFLGDLQFARGKYAEAAAAWDIQLQRTRQKARVLSGLAQAQSRLGKDDEARYANEKLKRIWSNADAVVKRELP